MFVLTKVEINNKSVSFNSIDEFYSWLLTDKNYEKNLIIEDETCENLYRFLKFYSSVKSKCSLDLEKHNKSFKNTSDNVFVSDSIEELIRMNSDGKFLRASLIALGYKTFSNKDDDKYLALASAYETFQTSILIHDDIIDNADVRRGKTTIPASYNDKLCDSDDIKRKEHISNSLGLCIGDLGFYLANKIIIENYKGEESFSKLLSLYNKIVINTIKGEIIDVVLPFKEQYSNKSITTVNDVMEIYKLKTAWYSIIGPYFLGMTLSGVDDDKISEMEEFLKNLGLAFQLKDDILGVFGDENVIGKSLLSDAVEFKQTILYAYLATNDKESLKELNKYYGNPNLKLEDLSKIKKIFIDAGAYKYAIDTMEELFEKSRVLLDKINFISDDYKKILYGFTEYLNLRTK